MPQERIEVIFVAKGQRQVERSIVQMSKAADSLSKSADKAAKSIAQMGKSSGGTGKVSAGVQKAGRDVKRLGNDAQKTAGRVNSLWKSLTVPAATGASIRETGRAMNSLIGRFAAFYSGRLLIGIADEFGRISNVLSGFGVASGEVDKVRKSINKVANAARVDAVQAATLFGRLRQATKGLGLSSQDLVGIVGTVNKALRLGGASSLEASQSIRQLSQAFNKGKLDGDEFRSVMENAPILQDLLTEKLGVTKDALFDLAAQGKITAKDLVEAFQEGADAIDEKFGKRIDTIGDALTVLKNQFREVFGAKVSGPAKLLVQAIVKIADNMERLLNIFTAFAAIKIFSALAVRAAAFVATLSKAAVLMKSLASFGSRYGAGAALAVGAKQIGLRGAAAAIPVVGQIALVAYTLYEVADAFGVFGKSAKEVAEETEAATERMIAAGLKLAREKGTDTKSFTNLSDKQYAELAKMYTSARIIGKTQQRIIREGTTTVNAPIASYGGRGGLMAGAPTRRVTRVSKDARDAKAALEKLNTTTVNRMKAGLLTAGEVLSQVRKTGEEGLSDEQLQKSIKLMNTLVRSELGNVGFSEMVSGMDAFASSIKEFGADSSESLNAYNKFVGGVVSAIPELSRNEAATDFLADSLKDIEKSGKPGLRTLLNLMDELKKYRRITGTVLDPKLAGGTKADQRRTEVSKLKRDLESLLKVQDTFLGKFPKMQGAFGRTLAAMREQIAETEDGLKKLNNELSAQLKVLFAVASVQQSGDGTEVLGPSFESFTDKQKAALADKNVLRAFGRELEQGTLKTALKLLDTYIAMRDEIAGRLAGIQDAAAAERALAAAATNRANIIKRVRADTEAIGKTLQQQQSLLFVGTKEQDEYQSAIEAFNQTRRRDFVTSRLAELKSTVVELQQLQEKARQSGLPAEDQKVIGNIVNKLKSEVAGLGAAIAQVGGEAARPLLEETATFLKGKAGEVGTQLGSALARAFDAAVKSGAAPLSASGAVAAGQKPGSVATFPTTDPTKDIANLRSGLSGVKNEILQLKNEFIGFGSLVGTQLKQAGNAAQNTANEIQGFFESAFGTLEDALVEFVTTGEFDFKKFINAIIADLARLVIRMLIIRPLMNFFGGIFGFGFANGGLVGQGGTLKKFSNGGQVGGVGGSTSDNQMILASRGEFVVSKPGVERAGLNNLIRLNAGGSLRSERRTVGSSTINFAPQITVVNDGGSDRDGQQQGEQIATMVRQSFTELLMKETRPGGMLESVNRKGFA